MTILVVEDEQKVAAFIKKGLEENGYDPFEENDEEELIIEWEPEDDEHQ